MSSKTPPDGGQAFPATASSVMGWQPGMSLRDYFAAQAMAGIQSNAWQMDALDKTLKSGEAVQRVIAQTAYQIADAMLAARGRAP
jgi:hypothetical protein